MGFVGVAGLVYSLIVCECVFFVFFLGMDNPAPDAAPASLSLPTETTTTTSSVGPAIARKGWTKENARGKHLLIAFNTYYLAVGEVVRRFPNGSGKDLNRAICAGLIEIYLTEMGEGANPRLLIGREKFKPFVIDNTAGVMELNDRGWEIVRAIIFAFRNKSEMARETMRSNTKALNAKG